MDRDDGVNDIILHRIASQRVEEGRLSDIISEGANALSRRIRRRDISCREVMALTLDRIAEHDRMYNAVPILRPRGELMAEAAAYDEELAHGQWRGWLHGIPQAIKDLAHAKGIRTTWGSPIFKDFVASEDSIHVARVRAAGAIIIGKTNTPEFGLGSHSYNPVHGVTRDAHDPKLAGGGSSGGAAVALALGYLAVADGSDMGGSLRNPAGWNGVFGFRPSYGRVPQTSVDDVYMGQLSTDGPMGVTVEDVAMLLEIQAGYDPRTPRSAQARIAVGDREFAAAHRPGHLPRERRSYLLDARSRRVVRSLRSACLAIGATLRLPSRMDLAQGNRWHDDGFLSPLDGDRHRPDLGRRPGDQRAGGRRRARSSHRPATLGPGARRHRRAACRGGL